MKTRDILFTILIVLFFLSILLFSLFKGCESRYDERNNLDSLANLYYSKYAIKLKGIITGKAKIDSRYCTYTVKVLQSTVKTHNAWEYHEDCYLFIMGDSAKFVDGNYIGTFNDEIYVDYTTRSKMTWSVKGFVKSDLPIFSPYYYNIQKQGLSQ